MRRLAAALAGALLLSALLLSGCILPPTPIAIAQAQARPETAPRPHLWYVGIALYGENWSENDVAEVAARLQRTADGFRVVSTVLSNRYGPHPDLPPASRAEIERTTGMIARDARPGDVVLLYVSTHGSPGLLARDLGGEQMEAVGARELRAWLAPLAAQPTVLVLSACFSGSLIPALRADNRIIIAAARADRTSFGCRADAEHSVFGEAFLDALEPHASLHQIVARTLREVAARERSMAVDRPSEPQVFVGRAASPLYEEQRF